MSATSASEPTATAPGEREELIARAAYHRAEQRGFQGGDPVADWLEAEAEIDALLARRAAAAGTAPAETAPPARETSAPEPTTVARKAGDIAPGARPKPASRKTSATETASSGREAEVKVNKEPAGARRGSEPASSDDDDQAALKAQLSANSDHLETLRRKLAKLKTGTRREMEREIVKLDSLRERLTAKADAAWQKSGKKREELRRQADKILQEFKTGLERLGSRFDR